MLTTAHSVFDYAPDIEDIPEITQGDPPMWRRLVDNVLAALDLPGIEDVPEAHGVEFIEGRHQCDLLGLYFIGATGDADRAHRLAQSHLTTADREEWIATFAETAEISPELAAEIHDLQTKGYSAVEIVAELEWCLKHSEDD